MKNKLLILAAILLFGALNCFAQNGGKAEANRIKFAKGKSSATVSGKVYGETDSEYVFAAQEGQKVTLKITSIPKGKYAAFKVLNAVGEPDFASDRDVNYDYTFTAPHSGDYQVWVNFRPAGSVKTARYSLTLAIK